MRAAAADQWTRPVSLSTFSEGKPETVMVTVVDARPSGSNWKELGVPDNAIVFVQV